MIAYLDSSVLLRVILGEIDRLDEWDRIDRGIASVLVEVECLRTLDRLRLQRALIGDKYEALRSAVFDLLERVELIEITRPVLSRAALSMPTPLGTLDAIHLATALTWQDFNEDKIVLATHDKALASAARASGVRTVGC